jgi:acetyltransferase-like isoleucine patch superfamily enzyme
MKINNNGINNSIDIHPSADIDDNSSISIKGNNNKIVIGENSVLRNANFIIESNENTVVIGSNCRITGRYIQKIIDGNCIEVGDNTTFGTVHIICGEGKKVSIGKDCMFAFDISLRTTDSHAIVDAISNERINFADDIIIGDHVWVAAHVIILKGTEIQKNSVVALKSLVTKKFHEDGIVIAGVPAKVIKKGINWERPLLG